MDRRLAVGMLGAATLGAFTAREARAEGGDTPIAHQLRGKRVGVWAGEFYYEGKVEIAGDSTLYLSGVRRRDQEGTVGDAVVHMAACQMITVLDSEQ